MKSASKSHTFWADEQVDYRSLLVSTRAFKMILLFYTALIAILVFMGTFVVMYKYLHPFLAWFWLIVMGASIGSAMYRRRQQQLYKREVIQIQERAKSQIGAIEIGSAIHVAGHPLLNREQPIVLALVADKGLCFYKYDDDQPLDVIPLEEIVSVFTVVYDDERTPHIEAVDSTAQALQIVFTREGKEFTTLLRSMKKLRAIDWYHALQKMRAQ